MLYHGGNLELDVHQLKDGGTLGGVWSLPWEQPVWGQIIQWLRTKKRGVARQMLSRTGRPEQWVFLPWFLLLEPMVLLAGVHVFCYFPLSAYLYFYICISPFATVKLLST